MNANELAEIIQHLENARYMGASKAATMLRQQQAEIDTYKSQNNNQIDTYKYKNLTDEEIIEVHVNNPFIDGYLNKNLIDFARAILRKAQEK